MTRFYVALVVIFLAFTVWYIGDYKIRWTIRTIKGYFRLKRIEYATKIKLMKWQRKMVLYGKGSFPHGRGRGKTTAAVFWTLLWRKEPINRSLERLKINRETVGLRNTTPAIPDPDAWDISRLEFTLQEYIRYAKMCEEKGIKVAHVVK